MLDAKYVRENPELVAKIMEHRKGHWDLSPFFGLDSRRRELIVSLEANQQRRNASSKLIGQLMKEGKKEEAEAKKAEVSAIKDEIAAQNAELEEVEEELRKVLLSIPNLPSEDTPDGVDVPGAPTSTFQLLSWFQFPCDPLYRER